MKSKTLFFEIGPFSIQSCYVIHAGPTVGFRINDHHSVFCYIPDHEPALGRTGLIKDLKWVSGGSLASNADLLVHDAQYTFDEYKPRIGWGHSCMKDAAEFACLTGVKHLLFSHHDPAHTDLQLKEMLSDFQKNNKYSFVCELAVEGMKFEI